jgi:hypothetical protein
LIRRRQFAVFEETRQRAKKRHGQNPKIDFRHARAAPENIAANTQMASG